MSQQSNEHFTITQLSAYRDKELTTGEFTQCQAHLQACQRCQNALADINLTASLLHNLPQVEVPRSFVLPVNTTISDISSGRRKAVSARRDRWHVALRSLSTVAAVLGLLFILFGFLNGLNLGGRTTGGSATSANPASALATTSNSTGASTGQASPSLQQYTQTTALPSPTPTGFAKHSISPASTEPPAFLNLSQPAGELEVGCLLFLPGLAGIFLERRQRKQFRKDRSR